MWPNGGSPGAASCKWMIAIGLLGSTSYRSGRNLIPHIGFTLAKLKYRATRAIVFDVSALRRIAARSGSLLEGESHEHSQARSSPNNLFTNYDHHIRLGRRRSARTRRSAGTSCSFAIPEWLGLHSAAWR